MFSRCNYAEMITDTGHAKGFWTVVDFSGFKAYK
jgi:hypothetical protein